MKSDLDEKCRRWECYENSIWCGFWQVMTLLIGIALTLALITLLSGCANGGIGFSIPISERTRCDIQIDAQLISTDPLPAIWLRDK